MPDRQFTATVGDDGTLTLPSLPDHSGEEVEVTVRLKGAKKPARPSPKLKGTLKRYDRPFDPAVSPEEWDAL